MENILRKIHIKQILKIMALTIAVILCLAVLFLAFLPRLVSSHAAQARIQKALAISMKRPVVWSDLALTWSAGLTLSDLKLGVGAAPLLKADIERIVITPSFGRGVDGRFGVDLAVKIQNIRAELAPGPPKLPTPSATKDPLTLLAESIQRIQKLDFNLPIDVRVMVDVSPVNVVYLAPAPAKQLRLDDFSFHFAMPSLATKPLLAEVKGRLSVDELKIGDISLNAKVSDLVTKERRIHIATALFAVDASAPGTNLTLSGGLSQPDGLGANLKLDLQRLMEIGHHFLPPNIPKIAGVVDLQLLAKVDANRDIHAAVTLDGTGLAANGGQLKARRVGPLDLKLQQQIATDHVRQKVDFPDGSFTVPGLINTEWSASVSKPSVPGRTLDLNFGPLRLDLAKAFYHAAPFLPPDTPVKNLAGEVSLRSLVLRLKGPANNGDLALTGLAVKVPRLKIALKSGHLTAEDIDLLLEKAACPLSAKLPTKLTAELLWSIKRAALSGAQPLIVQGARGTAGLAVNNLNLKSASPRKVTASVIVNQTLDLDSVSLGTQAHLEKVHEQLRLLATAAENGELQANIPELSVTAASLKGFQSGKRFGQIPLAASMTVAGFRLPADKGVKPSVQRASANVSAGDFLQLASEAALTGSSPQRVTTSGNAKLDLRRAMPFAAPFLPAGLDAAGIVTTVWDLAAPLPNKPGATDKHPLRSAKDAVSLLDKLEVALKLDNVSATVPSNKGTIKVTGLRTKPEFRIVLTGNGRSVTLEGAVLFSGVGGLPGAAGKLPTQHGSLTIKGKLSDWRDFHMSEELRIDPLALSQEAELSVSRIDALLEEKQPFSTATLIKRLDATLFVNLDGAFSRKLQQLLPGIDVAGNVDAAVRADLSAGRALALRSSLQTKDFGLRLANGTLVEGMRSNITFNRVYALAVSQGKSWTPLSTSLVRPEAVIIANPGAAGIVDRIHDDLRGNVRGGRSFSIRRVTTKTSGVPLLLTSLEGDLLLTSEKSGISFFQADLLGGTLLASGVFDLQPEVPTVAASTSFSNLDITGLLPQETKRLEAGQNAEITGEMSLSAPLTAEQRELFEQLRLMLNLRKIGANTIERALFSLDPYERNEQLVAQRKMLRHGTLKGLRANAVDGSFSMEGEVQIKGVAVELPKVERLRISELPIRQELVKNRSKINSLRNFLDLLRADMLVVGPKGELSLKRRDYAQ